MRPMMSPDEMRWRAEDDLRTLKRAAEVTGDPERIRAAQNCLKEEQRLNKAVLNIPTPPPTPGRRNPATVMPLPDPFSRNKY